LLKPIAIEEKILLPAARRLCGGAAYKFQSLRIR
jgi:hypothetical protein